MRTLRTVSRLAALGLGLAAVLGALVNTVPGYAGWSDNSWSDKHPSRYGNPAITINAETGVTIVLPEPSILDAQAAGLSPQQAAVTFLGKYGPEMCSQIIDLNEPRPALSIKLVIQYERSLLDASVDTQRSVNDAMAKIERDQKRLSGADNVFEVVPEGEAWTIDYVPTHRAKCAGPPEGGVASTTLV